MTNRSAEASKTTYTTEGYVKNITKASTGLNFTLEAVAPYLFESKEKKDDGSVKRKILLVTDDETDARIYTESLMFKVTKNELAALLIAKANRMKMRLTVGEKEIEQTPLVVNKLEML